MCIRDSDNGQQLLGLNFGQDVGYAVVKPFDHVKYADHAKYADFGTQVKFNQKDN